MIRNDPHQETVQEEIASGSFKEVPITSVSKKPLNALLHLVST
jgi:hypothetical protein